MTRTRNTLTIDEELLTAVKVMAARTGKSDSQIIEELLRRDFGFDLLDDIWERATHTEVDAMKLARKGQKAARNAKA